MERCSVKPYKGKEQYIVVCYSHEDEQCAFPIIERLVRDGYRVWYNENTELGMEWAEDIAQHINECSACIALITENFADSHSCRQEINFAMKKRKKFLSVMLEKVENMSLGMEMQLSASPTLWKYTMGGENEFFSRFYETGLLEGCLGEMDKKKKEQTSSAHFYLVRTKSNEVIDIVTEELILGRSAKQCQYVIRNNSLVGRCHAIIKNRGESCKVIDNHSLNGTFLNGNRMEPGKEYHLQDNDKLVLSNEVFTFHLR